MFTGFETALIEEYPGLSERKRKNSHRYHNRMCTGKVIPVCMNDRRTDILYKDRY